MIICVLVLPIVYVLGLDPSTSDLIASLAFGFGSILTLVLLFLPKWFTIRESSRKKSQKNVYPAGTEEEQGKQEKGATDTHTVGPEGMQFLFKGKTQNQRLEVCYEQMHLWQGELIKLQESVLRSKSGASDSEQSQASARSENNFSKRSDFLSNRDSFGSYRPPDGYEPNDYIVPLNEVDGSQVIEFAERFERVDKHVPVDGVLQSVEDIA